MTEYLGTAFLLFLVQVVKNDFNEQLVFNITLYLTLLF